jgi:Flp pilus assembly protein TadD
MGLKYHRVTKYASFRRLIRAYVDRFVRQEALNQGIAAFKSGNYQQAVELLQQEVAAHPNGVNAHLCLGTAYMSQ